MNYPTPSDVQNLTERLTTAIDYHQQGQYDLALQHYQDLRRVVDSPLLSYNIGLILYDLGDFSAALEAFRDANELAPDDVDTLFNLALCYKECGYIEKAAARYEQILAIHPAHADALYNLAGCHKDLRCDDMAIVTYKQVLELSPEHLSALNNLAYMYQLTGKRAEAITCYRHLLELDPKREGAQFMLSALHGETEQKPPTSYVRELFDRYSTHFEESLLDRLEYSVPRQLRSLVLDSIADASRFSAAIDLGCGTGLGGEAFVDLVDNLDGVDLSPKMIAIAEKKQLYRQLVAGDLLEYLSISQERYDLLLATDVFGYLGDLHDIFTIAAVRAARPSIFTFSIEDGTAEDFLLLPTGRYAHSQSYIRGLLAESGWRVLTCEHARLRREGDGWVTGTLWVAKRS